MTAALLVAAVMKVLRSMYLVGGRPPRFVHILCCVRKYLIRYYDNASRSRSYDIIPGTWYQFWKKRITDFYPHRLLLIPIFNSVTPTKERGQRQELYLAVDAHPCFNVVGTSEYFYADHQSMRLTSFTVDKSSSSIRQ